MTLHLRPIRLLAGLFRRLVPVLLAGPALAMLAGAPAIRAQDLPATFSDELPFVTLADVGAGPALIIAVDTYEPGSPFPDLPGIDRDSQAVKAMLLRLGFAPADIKVLVNPTQQEMKDGMNRFGQAAALSRKASFLYCTGHGVLMDGKNYLIPSKAPIYTQGHLVDFAVPIELALGYLGGEECGPALVFVDACRNNGLPRTAKSALSPVHLQQQTGLFIGYATGEGRLANATDTGSVFTASLCRRLLTPGRSVDDIYAGIIQDVRKATAGEVVVQNPQKQSALRVVLHLVSGSGGSSGGSPPPPPRPMPPDDPPRPPKRVIPSAYGDITSIWDHNGSTVGMVEEGQSVQIVYLSVRKGLRSFISDGSLLFKGRVSQDSVSGSARRFKPGLSAIAYACSGEYNSSHTRLVMYGKAPKRNSAGQVEKLEDEELIFTLKERL